MAASKVGEVSYEVKIDTSAVKGEMARANSEIEKEANKGGQEASQALSAGMIAKSQLVVGAVKTIIGAAIGGIKNMISVGMEFDSSMSQVAATLGTTVDQIGDLRDFAQKMGSATVFSATQSAEALNYMALAGYDAKTSMKMLPSVLNLAAAGNIELATASDMVTDAQSALGLSLEETERLVDEMAKTASSSNTSVAQLGEALLTVGGTASYMADGTSEINSVLGVLADNGIKGSEAGTHLRNMLLSLASPTKDATKLLDKLGVQVFDSNGKMRSFSKIFPELNSAMADFTDQEKLDAFSVLFNSRDIASATALLSTTTERWDELGGKIADAGGAAQAMANTQLDNLQGDVTLFNSALEGLWITLSDQLQPVLRGIVSIATGLANFLKENPGVIYGVVAAVVALTGAFVAYNAQAIIAAITNPFAWLAIATVAVGAFLGFVIQHFQEIGDFIGNIVNGIKSMFGAVVGWFNDHIIAPIGDFFSGLWNGIRTGAEGLVNGIRSIFSSILNVVKAPINGAIGALNLVISGINLIPGVNIAKIPYLATGGIIEATAGGQLIVAGEGGQDEWVVPESKMASLVDQLDSRRDSRGGDIIINVYGTFATSETEQRKVAQVIADKIEEIQRSRLMGGATI